jgi:hypothetical protein
VGRHAESGSDGRDRGNAPLTVGRRRTDVPDALWRGPAAELSDHPTTRGRERPDDAVCPPAARPTPAPAPVDSARQLSRSRLPLPPVPAPSRSAARPAVAAAPSAPRTTAAPFQAVPSPELRADVAVDDVRPLPFAAQLASAPAAPPLERRKRPRTATPAPERPRSAWHEAESALVSSGASGLRASGPLVPRQTTAAGSSAPAYGDWTKPSRDDDPTQIGPAERDAALLTDPDGPRLPPGTTGIPERSVSRRRGNGIVPADGPDGRPRDQAPPAVRGPGTGPVVGGRAAQRAERQAADAVRRKAEKQRGSAVAVLDDVQVRKPRRVIKGLVAMTVVALGVLGVYTVVSPPTSEIAAKSPARASTSAAVAAPTAALPELPTAPLDVEPIVAAPVRVPVTVLNATEITGLAAKIAETVVAAGWESPGVGAYQADDVAASTVYFTEGDENQRQSAVQLIDQFPQLQGPAPRFFELPADVVAPGLVIVATGDWQP